MNILPDWFKKPIVATVESLSTTSKVIFAALGVAMVICAFIMLADLNDHFLVEVPSSGGTFTEGIVGTPRLINPVLVDNDPGRDIASFVYAGLMQKDPSGTIVPQLADHYTVSPDGLTYTFTLKPNLYFQDGVALTASDVVFTIDTIQNPQIRSPRAQSFQNIQVSAPDDKTVVFTLQKQSNTFLQSMTVGILPEHIWKSVDPNEFSAIEYNDQPVGAGPYMIQSVSRGKGGLPVEYDLTPFVQYVGGKPLLDQVIFKIYQDSEEAVAALKSGDINAVGGILPSDAIGLKAEGYRIETHSLPRMFGLFFNQNQNPIFSDATVRQVLSGTAPRQAIIDQVFGNYATPIDSPFSDTLDASSTMSSATVAALLTSDGWKIDGNGIYAKKLSSKDATTTELAFSISTSDVDDLKATADLLKTAWGALGINVTVNIYESGELNQTIINQRNYDSLLFGQVVLQPSDYIAFWHSSQIKSPGLNVAEYANPAADKLLIDYRDSTSTDESVTDLASLDTIFQNDMPAVMLYSPEYIHVVPEDLSGYYEGPLTQAADRFIGNADWYMNAERVWPFFARNRKILTTQ